MLVWFAVKKLINNIFHREKYFIIEDTFIKNRLH
jgi:hypothetical protein